MTTQPPTVSVVQASPVYLDRAASLDKVAGLIEQAAKQGAQLVTFGETWLPGYPAWLDCCPDAALWDHEPTKEVFARLYENSVRVPDATTKTLARLAKAHGVVLVIGVNEVEDGNGTIYNSILTFDADGRLANHHRKLMPTYTERLVWGQGDARGLRVVETAAGRVGGLICWEHWMPLARQAIHDQGEQIHIALWPSIKEMYQVASRHYAFEGRCFVLAAGLLMRAADIPGGLTLPPDLAADPEQFILKGGSSIIGPDGAYLAGPVFEEETILTAELDLRAIAREKMALDTSGHYARPDLFHFGIRDVS
jgi:predicted amidohydrolase